MDDSFKMADDIRHACALQPSANHPKHIFICSSDGSDVPDNAVTCNFEALKVVLRRER